MYLSDRNEGPPECSVCPAGFYCQSGKKTPCNLGTYSPANSASCYLCPEDAVCTDPAKAPERCPFGWQRKGEEVACTPCPAGKMCGGWSGSVMRGLSEVACPLGTYTKPEYPGICVPCPPGFQCPDPQLVPEPCPPGTNSLGGRRKCSSAPAGLIVEPGKQHLPARPCEDGLRPLELAGQWWCGVGYDDLNLALESSGPPMRSSPADNLVAARSESFPDVCGLEHMDHITCFSSSLPPTTWCPTYPVSPISWPSAFRKAPFFAQGGAFSQYFTSCGYLRSLDESSTRVRIVPDIHTNWKLSAVLQQTRRT